MAKAYIFSTLALDPRRSCAPSGAAAARTGTRRRRVRRLVICCVCCWSDTGSLTKAMTVPAERHLAHAAVPRAAYVSDTSPDGRLRHFGSPSFVERLSRRGPSLMEDHPTIQRDSAGWQLFVR